MQLLFLFLTVWRSPPSTHPHTHTPSAARSSVSAAVCVTTAGPLQDKENFGRPLSCGCIKQALFIGPLLLHSVLISVCVCVGGRRGACLCVCIFKSLRRLLSSWKDDNDSDHTQGLFSSRHKRGSVHNSSWRTYCTYDVFYDTSEMQCDYVLN